MRRLGEPNRAPSFGAIQPQFRRAPL